MSIHTFFEITNNAILLKILVIAGNRSARFRVSSALGALGAGLNPVAPNLKNQVIL